MQLLHASALPWLKTQAFDKIQFNAILDKSTGLLDVKFGFPSETPEEQQKTLANFVSFSKRTERLRTLLSLLEQVPEATDTKALRSGWTREGAELYKALYPHVGQETEDIDDAISNFIDKPLEG